MSCMSDYTTAKLFREHNKRPFTLMWLKFYPKTQHDNVVIGTHSGLNSEIRYVWAVHMTCTLFLRPSIVLLHLVFHQNFMNIKTNYMYTIKSLTYHFYGWCSFREMTKLVKKVMTALRFPVRGLRLKERMTVERKNSSLAGLWPSWSVFLLATRITWLLSSQLESKKLMKLLACIQGKRRQFNLFVILIIRPVKLLGRCRNGVRHASILGMTCGCPCWHKLNIFNEV